MDLEKEQSPIWAKLNIHDDRIARLESDMRAIREELSDITVAVKLTQQTVTQQEHRLMSSLREQFLQHEARESTLYIRAILYGVGLLTAAFGGLAWYVLSHIDLS